jgi:hypothetical protein
MSHQKPDCLHDDVDPRVLTRSGWEKHPQSPFSLIVQLDMPPKGD